MNPTKLAPALLAAALAACNPTQPAPPAAQVLPAAPAPRAYAPVAALPGAMDDIATLRGTDNEARRAAVIALLESRGFTPTLHEFPNDADRDGDTRETGRNVVIEFGEGEMELVIGGHFDAVPVGEGMLDNAGSVVVLANAAAALRDLDLGHRFRFVFFDMEEIGLVGARHYATTLDPAQVRAMINLDVNAYGDTVFYGHTRHGHDELYQAMRRGCTGIEITCVEFGVYPPSDNLAFQQAGFPNISLSVLPEAEVHQLWLMMNERENSGLAEGFLPGVFLNIHSAGDHINRVEPAAMTLAYNTLMSLVTELTEE